MVETAAKPAAATPAAGKPSDAKKDKKKKGQKRNYDLGCGVYRFSRARMYHKKALYKFMGKTTPKSDKPKVPVTVQKAIGGEKNEGFRTVYLKKRTKSYPTANRVNRHPSKKCFAQHKRKFRASLTPGAVVILLAGLHKGKRAVLLRNLPSGLLLVTGPFTLNGVPLRRIHPNYVIATSARVDVSEVKLPKHMNDKYFKRLKAKRTKKDDGEIFAPKKEPYKPTDQRKTDQKVVDKQVLKALQKGKDVGLMRRYLCTMFGLKSSQYPHRMKF
ncbi:60S ribosomal protein L6 [Cimex lectularius]|uniref:Large ribosomal subunit protein eL6 n=1 Tax=Cimex lectularius TaxID=79782 RepID=A0A8I6RA29_CIMLE|nr:60S ribosomal protein L6 [Cimex lectularius]XP_014240586.1 60S ribosomal protein L6 [Cimex lectularius]